MLTDLDETNRLRILSETLPAAVQAILANEAVTIAAHPAVCMCVQSSRENSFEGGGGSRSNHYKAMHITHSTSMIM